MEEADGEQPASRIVSTLWSVLGGRQIRELDVGEVVREGFLEKGAFKLKLKLKLKLCRERQPGLWWKIGPGMGSHRSPEWLVTATAMERHRARGQGTWSQATLWALVPFGDSRN